jgi:hypothetical protein
MRAEELADWAMPRYVNRSDIYGGHTAVADRGKPTRKGTPLGKRYTYPTEDSKRVDGALHRGLFVRHFIGRSTGDVIGVHGVSKSNTSLWVLFDFDRHEDTVDPDVNRAAAIYYYCKLTSMGFSPLLYESDDRGGFHLVVFFSVPITSADAYHFGRWIVRDQREPHVGLAEELEVNPKQTNVDGGAKCGNWCRIIGRYHTRDVWPRVFDGERWLDGDSAIDVILAHVGDAPALIPEEAKTPPVVEKPKPAPRRRPDAFNLPHASGGDPAADVIALFNSATPIRDFLRHHGYTNSGERMLRPGASDSSEPSLEFLTRDNGTEAVVSYSVKDQLYHPDKRSHDAFGCYTVLEHGGDSRKAYIAAARMLNIPPPPSDDEKMLILRQRAAERMAAVRVPLGKIAASEVKAPVEVKAAEVPPVETVVTNATVAPVTPEAGTLPEFELVGRNLVREGGTTKAHVDLMIGGKMVFTDGVNGDSAGSRRRFGKRAAPYITGLDAGADLTARVMAEVEERLIASLVNAEVPEEKDDPAIAEARARIAESREQRRQAMVDTADQYVLLPGAHDTDDEFLEIGTHTFAAEVIGRFPPESIYRRGKPVVRLDGAVGKRTCTPLEVDDVRMIVDASAKLARWVTKGKGKDAMPVRVFEACSKDAGGIVLAAARGDQRVPPIDTLSHHPVYGPDWTLTPPGYRDGVYYDQPADLEGFEPETDRNVIIDTLHDLVVDFPFTSDADRENFFGLLLTPLIRPAIKGNVPMHATFAPLERTGKSKLLEGVGCVFLGSPMPAQKLPDKDEEADKRVMSQLIRGDAFLNLDNLREFVDSPVLAMLLTATVYQGRNLGRLEAIDLPNTLVLMGSGNNVRFTGEMAKRIVPINLTPTTDAPELRTDFTHPDFALFATENRRLVLSCLAGMVETWKANGRPKGRRAMGGFDQWASTVGGILGLYGFDKWMTNAAEWRESSNPTQNDLRAFVAAWFNEYQTTSVTATLLMMTASNIGVFADILSTPNERGRSTAFGMKVMNRYLDTPVSIEVNEEPQTMRFRRVSQSAPTKYALEVIGANRQR